MTIILPLIGVLLMLAGGFIGGFYAYAAENQLQDKHPLTAEKKKRTMGKILQLTLILGALYLIVVTVDIALAGLAYIYAEYGFPRIMRSRYKRIFGQTAGDAGEVLENKP